MDSSLYRHATGILDAETNHTDNDSSGYTGERGHGQPRHVVQSSRQGADERNDQAHHHKNDSAGTMIGQDIEGDGKGNQVTGHEKDKKEQLGNPEQLSTKPTQEDLASVGHTGYEWISQLKLAHEISSICSDSTYSGEYNQGTVQISNPCLVNQELEY